MARIESLSLLVLLTCGPSVKSVLIVPPKSQTQLHTISCPVCTAGRSFGSLPDGLVEASGLAISHRDEVPQGIYYHITDSPYEATEVIATDAAGSELLRIKIEGIAGTEWLKESNLGTGNHYGDWEAVTAAPCKAGDKHRCIFVGDFGNNCAREGCPYMRAGNVYSLIRLPEPALTSLGNESFVTIVGQRLFFRYIDGPHDAETLVSAPDGRLFVVTKGANAMMYELPETFAQSVDLKNVELIPTATKVVELLGVPKGHLITGGDFLLDEGGGIVGLTLVSYDAQQNSNILHYPIGGPVPSRNALTKALEAQQPCALPSDGLVARAEGLAWESHATRNTSLLLTSDRGKGDSRMSRTTCCLVDCE